MARQSGFISNYVSRWFLILFVAVGFQSCFSDDDETELETEEPTEEAAAEAVDQTAAAEGAGAESVESAAAELEASANATPTEGAAADDGSSNQGAQSPSLSGSEATSGQPVSSSPTPSMVDSSGKKVLYVAVNKAVMRDGPTESAKVIKTLRKGDHLLFTVEGDWAKTDDGGYVSMKNLSEKGVGRKKSKPKWK